MQVVVGKILLDHIALVAETDHKLMKPIVRIDLHDVPENRLAADLDHGFRSECRLLTDPRAKSARQNNDFHAPAPFLIECFANDSKVIYPYTLRIRKTTPSPDKN